MNKLLSVIVAAMFAVSTTAFVASPVGAQEKKAEKTEKTEKKKAANGDAKAAPKKEAKADKKKSEGKKKDEMKK